METTLYKPLKPTYHFGVFLLTNVTKRKFKLTQHYQGQMNDFDQEK